MAHGASKLLARWGRFVHRRRALVLAVSGAMLAIAAVVLMLGGRLSAVITADVEAVRAANLIARELPTKGKSSFSLIFRDPAADAYDPRFRERVRASLAPIEHRPHVTAVVDPWSLPTAFWPTQTSTDRHAAVVDVWLDLEPERAVHEYAALRRAVRADGMSVTAAGALAEQHDFDAVLEHDLIRAEIVSVPLTIAVLLAVFGSAVAALLPVGIGLSAVAAGIAVIFGLSRLMPVTPYALNVTSLIGLGVAIDYSLFIVSRFREELAAGAEVERAVETAVATAGRAVAFSGLAVTIGLSGLVFYRGMFLDVIGIAAALVVLFAVLAALGPLPALLSLLGHRIDRWKLPRLALTGREEHWRRLGDAVMRHPLLVLVPVLAVLVAAGTPFMHIRTANSDVTVLPDETEARRGYEALAKDFPFRDPNPIVLVAKFPGDPRTMSRMVAIGRLSASLLDMPEVARVDGPVPMELLVDRVRALSLLANPPKDPPKEMQLLLEKTTGASIAVIAVKTKHGPIAPETRALLAELRTIGRVGDGELLVTGRTAADADLFEYVKSRTPRTVALVLGATFIVLLVALRSIALPIKAAFMNVVSIAASFGALVWVFQDGHLAGVLGFSPRPIEPVLPVLLFCLVFGLSMDYELLLLSRMQEEWRATADNRRAVIEGMAKTSQLITSAAAIMVVVFAAFAAARVVLIKAIGLGMALAVALDATVVRSLVVPATMRLLGDWNWWSPFAKRGDEVDRGDRSG